MFSCRVRLCNWLPLIREFEIVDFDNDFRRVHLIVIETMINHPLWGDSDQIERTLIERSVQGFIGNEDGPEVGRPLYVFSANNTNHSVLVTSNVEGVRIIDELETRFRTMNSMYALFYMSGEVNHVG